MTRDGKSFKNYENIIAKNNSDNSLSAVQSLALFHNLYITSILSGKVNLLKNQYRIPRIIHQIWLGNQMPEKYVQWVSSWLRLQGWTYRLWTDKEVDKLLLYNRTLYNNSENYGEKSDILRLELLYHYGGIYADIDCECINENIFEELHKSYDFYIGFEPLEHGLTNEYNSIKMCNALIGSIPGHPILKKMIVNMQDNYSAYKNSSPIERTGPDYLSRTIIKYEMQKEKNFYTNIYLPCSFFYYISAYFLNEVQITSGKASQNLHCNINNSVRFTKSAFLWILNQFRIYTYTSFAHL